MITLEKYKLLLKTIGFQPHGGLGDIVRRFILCFAFFSILLMSWILFMVNIGRDSKKAWDAMCVFAGFMTHGPIYSHLIVSRKRMYSLLNDLQDVVNESKNKHVDSK